MADRGTMSDGCFDPAEPGAPTPEPGWLDRGLKEVRELAVLSMESPVETPAERDIRIALELRATRCALRGAFRELSALEWLALNGYPVGRGADGRVMASFREEDAEPDWCANWTEAARKLGKA